MSAQENMSEPQFVGRTVKFTDKPAGTKGKGNQLTGTVKSHTPAGAGSRYDRFVIEHEDGTRYTRDASTVKFMS